MNTRICELKNGEEIVYVAIIISCSLDYANDLIKNDNNNRQINELIAVAFWYSKPMSVYFRQPTKRGEKAATSRGSSPSRIEPTA